MRIQRISLVHFRGISDLSLELHGQLNVFSGVNGSGKSTVLDAAALLLSWLVNRIGRAGASGRHISESDIANGKSFSRLGMQISLDHQKTRWQIVKTRKGYQSPGDRTDLSELNPLAGHFQERISETGEKANLPLLVYYPVNRAVLDIPVRIRKKHPFNLLSAYEEALTGAANFRAFFEWFREREDMENESRKYLQIPVPGSEEGGQVSEDPPQFPDPQLEAVRRALQTLMPEFRNPAVRRNPLRMEVKKNGRTLAVDQLSDGEKCSMAMVGDLARRMAMANPARPDPLNGEGIVLIDEIDLHLHPKWQRRMIPRLTEVFPNCQFLISTHSPHVLTHVRPESVFFLRQAESGIVAEKPSESYGKNVDRILEDLMGLETTRPETVHAELGALHKTIGEGRLDEARERIAELKETIGEDPELVRAEVLIRRKEIIGK